MTDKQFIEILQKEIKKQRAEIEQLKSQAKDANDMIYLFEETINYAEKIETDFFRLVGKKAPWSDLLLSTVAKAKALLQKVKK